MPQKTHEYLFDVKLFASIRITAENETEARKQLQALLDCADVAVSDPDDNDQTLTFECSQDGEADLMQIDGEEPED